VDIDCEGITKANLLSDCKRKLDRRRRDIKLLLFPLLELPISLVGPGPQQSQRPLQ